MSLSALQQDQLGYSTVFTGRLKVILGEYAKYVQTAPIGGVITQASKDLATRIQSDPGSMAGKIAVSIVSDGGIKGSTLTGTLPTVDTTKTDPELDGIVQAVWNSGAWNNIY